MCAHSKQGWIEGVGSGRVVRRLVWGCLSCGYLFDESDDLELDITDADWLG